MRRLAGVLTLGSALLACQVEEPVVEAGTSSLIGGRPGVLMPATVYITDGCTAAKVGPRMLLTAAHCVLNLGTLEPKYGPTRPVSLTPDPAEGSKQYGVAKVHVHPKFLEQCAATFCSIAAVAAKLDAPDIGVLELAESLDVVPSARIDDAPLAPGDPVIIEGFGCTRGVHVPDDRKIASLTSAETAVVAAEAALHDGSYVVAADMPVYSGNYALTPGPGASGSAAGLCPGDSGGPLYARRERTSKEIVKGISDLVIVGVNANYSLFGERFDDEGLPVTNWHTRIDRDSRNGVSTWLRSVLAGP